MLNTTLLYEAVRTEEELKNEMRGAVRGVMSWKLSRPQQNLSHKPEQRQFTGMWIERYPVETYIQNMFGNYGQQSQV